MKSNVSTCADSLAQPRGVIITIVSVRVTAFCANSLTNRPHQREIIEAALKGYDVYVQAATSFGKSLCFQLPAVIDHGSKSTVIGNKAHRHR
jgi:ATP-dependent helicase YprA (DUF1998 family)